MTNDGRRKIWARSVKINALRLLHYSTFIFEYESPTVPLIREKTRHLTFDYETRRKNPVNKVIAW